MATAALVAVAAGCGGDEEEPETTPASVVPASSLVYADVSLRPEGEERTAVEAPLAALLGSEDPGGLIVEELDRDGRRGRSEIAYEADVEPWLGEHGAIFFTSLLPTETAVEESFAEKGVEGAFVVESTDPDAAQAFVDKANARTKIWGAASWEPSATTWCSVSDAGFEEVVGTEAGGESLADDPGYAEVDGRRRRRDRDPVRRRARDRRCRRGGRRALGRQTARRSTPSSRGVAEQPLTAVVDAETTGFGLEVSHGATEVPFLSAAGGVGAAARAPRGLVARRGVPERRRCDRLARSRARRTSAWEPTEIDSNARAVPPRVRARARGALRAARRRRRSSPAARGSSVPAAASSSRPAIRPRPRS